MEEVLDSKNDEPKTMLPSQVRGFGVEHNSWEPWDNIHAPELVMDFYWRHPAAPCHIRTVVFDPIPFCPSSPSTVLGHHSLEGGVDVRGHPILPHIPDSSDLCSNTSFNTLPYIPLHCRFLG